jgi:hypothetical protein
MAKKQAESRWPVYLVAAVVAVLAIVLAVWLVRSHRRPVRPASIPRMARPAWLPDPHLTPGGTFAVSESEVCRPGYARAARDVPGSVKREVCRLYGVPYPARGYEIDHLIPLALGGSNEVSNLWPQTGEGRWTFRQKDQLEVRLHAMACRGEITMSQAQEMIRSDWTVPYRRYVQPEPAHLPMSLPENP